MEPDLAAIRADLRDIPWRVLVERGKQSPCAERNASIVRDVICNQTLRVVAAKNSISMSRVRVIVYKAWLRSPRPESPIMRKMCAHLSANGSGHGA